MSDVYPGDVPESPDKGVDELYAALLDDIGVSRMPSAPGDVTVAPVAPMEQLLPPTPLSPAPGVDDTAPRLVPGVARSSYVAPAPEDQVLLSATSSTQPEDVPGSPTGDSSSIGIDPSDSTDSTSLPTDSPRPRPSFDDILYGRATRHSTPL